DGAGVPRDAAEHVLDVCGDGGRRRLDVLGAGAERAVHRAGRARGQPARRGAGAANPRVAGRNGGRGLVGDAAGLPQRAGDFPHVGGSAGARSVCRRDRSVCRRDRAGLPPVPGRFGSGARPVTLAAALSQGWPWAWPPACGVRRAASGGTCPQLRPGLPSGLVRVWPAAARPGLAGRLVPSPRPGLGRLASSGSGSPPCPGCCPRVRPRLARRLDWVCLVRVWLAASSGSCAQLRPGLARSLVRILPTTSSVVLPAVSPGVLPVPSPVLGCERLRP